MKISKSTVVALAAIGVIGTTSATALASTTNSGTQNSLAEDIAAKFHLNQSDVQQVIDQHKETKLQNRESHYEDRLTQAVNGGKLTEAQKQAVLTEHNKLMSELKSSSNIDKHLTMQNIRKEAQDWAKQNNIDIKWLMPPMRGMHHMMGDNNTQ
jgi:hypothetical protein